MASRPLPVLVIDYPEGPLADEIEAWVDQRLPVIPNLLQAATLEERVAIYEQVGNAQREAFVAQYGLESGAERRIEPRAPAAVAVDEPIVREALRLS